MIRSAKPSVLHAWAAACASAFIVPTGCEPEPPIVPSTATAGDDGDDDDDDGLAPDTTTLHTC